MALRLIRMIRGLCDEFVVVSLLLLILVPAIGAISGCAGTSSEVTSPVESDEILIGKLNDCVDQTLGPRETIDYIGRSPLISTYDEGTWEIVKYALDAAHYRQQEIMTHERFANAMFWPYQSNSADPKFVGVSWDRYGEPQLAYIVVFSP